MRGKPGKSASLVVVVDDEASVRRALGRLVRSLDYDCREFASGRELLADEHHAEAGCFIIDINMPELDGYGLGQRLEETAPEVPVILISARVEEHDRWREKAPRAIGLLSKPFSARELAELLEKALG